MTIQNITNIILNYSHNILLFLSYVESTYLEIVGHGHVCSCYWDVKGNSDLLVSVIHRYQIDNNPYNAFLPHKALLQYDQNIIDYRIHQTRWNNSPRKPLLPEELREKVTQNESFLGGIQSQFDFTGILALAGFWAIWNWLLIGFITPDAVGGLINAILGLGKRFTNTRFQKWRY